MSLISSAKGIVKAREEDALAADIGAMPADIRELTGYEPRPLQASLEAEEKRFNVEVMHRRFGKTVFKVNKLIERAVDCPFPEGRYGYFAPTYAQAEDIAWHYLDQYTNSIPGRLLEKSRLSCWVPTRLGSRARIRLYGLDSPKQRVRGLYLDGAVFDEYSWIPPSAWTEQVRPMLTDVNRSGVDALGRVNQWADFIFTPFGRNHAHTLYRNARLWHMGEAVRISDPLSGVVEEVRRDDWYAKMFKASETGILVPGELKAALIDMGQSKYDQEYECSFDAAVEGAIFAREIEELRSRGRICNMPWNKLLPVNTAWDLGWDDATAIWFFQQVGDEIRVIDYYEATGAGLDHYADVMAEKCYRYGYNLFPHDVAVHELGTGKSRSSVLRSLGVRVAKVPKHKKWDGIAAAQALLPKCVFDGARCADGLDRLSLYRREYKEKLDTFSEKPLHDWASHGADAFISMAMGLRRARSGDAVDPHLMTHSIY